jgi:hypothetical protein
MKQQNQLEAPGLFVKPLCQAVPDVYSHDNHPQTVLIRVSGLSDIKGQLGFYPQFFFEGEQRREHLPARSNTQIPCCKAAAPDVAKT